MFGSIICLAIRHTLDGNVAVPQSYEGACLRLLSRGCPGADASRGCKPGVVLGPRARRALWAWPFGLSTAP